MNRGSEAPRPDRRRALFGLGGLGLSLAPRGVLAAPLPSQARPVPVLVYHRFAPTALDSMTVRHATFESHLRLLEQTGCHPVSLQDLVEWRRGSLASLPPRAVCLTADDGHRSQFEAFAPRLRERGWPASLFIYPSAISNASYAMTWEQLQALRDQGFDLQSHTYWHPDLVRERQQRAPADFDRFARDQLERSRARLHERLGVSPSLLAWPFGRSDEGLQQLAREVGYRAAFSLGNRSISGSDDAFALPRHLMVDAVDSRQLARRLASAFGD